MWVFVPAIDRRAGGRISRVLRLVFSILTLESPRLMLISRYRAARAKTSTKVGISAVSGTAVAAIILATILIGSQLIAVTVDGRIVGYVENEEQYASLLQRAKEKLSERVGAENGEIIIQEATVSLETIIVPQQQALSAGDGSQNGSDVSAVVETPVLTEANSDPEQEETLIDSLIESLIDAGAVTTTLYTISVDDKKLVALSTLKEAQDVYKAIADRFTPALGDFTGRFIEDVKIDGVTVKLGSISPMKPEEAIATLLGGTAAERVYAAVEEDTVENICDALGISAEALAGYYPNYDFEKIAEGDVFRYVYTKPYVQYEIEGTEIVIAPIAFETIEEKSMDLYLGQREIKVAGELGEKMVTRLVQRINGEIVYQEDIRFEVIQEARDEIVLVGTKFIVAGEDAYVGYSDGTGGGGTGALGRPLDSWYLSRTIGAGHNGADMIAPRGTPIYASAYGRVTFSGYYSSYGNIVMIDHGNGLQTYYAHCDTLNVQAGDIVERGQQIATVGTTGRSTAYHLHFEVRVNGVVQNPLDWI